MTRTEETRYALTILLIGFVLLKASGVIAWSWLWVLCPLWVPLAVAVLVFLVGLIIALCVEIIKSIKPFK